MLTVEERYRRDPLFRRIVDKLEALLCDAQMTGTEIREAAMLAAIHNEASRRYRKLRPKDVFEPDGFCRYCGVPRGDEHRPGNPCYEQEREASDAATANPPSRRRAR